VIRGVTRYSNFEQYLHGEGNLEVDRLLESENPSVLSRVESLYDESD
jgi:hypothetical protein